jgi:hypothetical protein
VEDEIRFIQEDSKASQRRSSETLGHVDGVYRAVPLACNRKF